MWLSTLMTAAVTGMQEKCPVFIKPHNPASHTSGWLSEKHWHGNSFCYLCKGSPWPHKLWIQTREGGGVKWRVRGEREVIAEGQRGWVITLWFERPGQSWRRISRSALFHVFRCIMAAAGRNYQNFLESDCWKEASLLALPEKSAWIVQRKDKMKCPLGTRLSVVPVELSSLGGPA